MRGDRIIIIVALVAVLAGVALLLVLRKQTRTQRLHREQIERQLRQP